MNSFFQCPQHIPRELKGEDGEIGNKTVSKLELCVRDGVSDNI